MLTQAMMNNALLEWLSGEKWTHFLTLNINDKSNYAAAEKLLKRFHQRVDRSLLGPKYFQRPERRLLLIAFPEHVAENFHYHCLIRFRCRCEHTDRELDDILAKKWKEVIARGSTNMQPIYNLAGVSSYITKELWKPGRYGRYVILSGET